MNGERARSIPIVLAVVGAFALDALHFARPAREGPRAAAADRDFSDRRGSFELHKDGVAVGHQRHRITAIAAGGGADVFRDDRIDIGLELDPRDLAAGPGAFVLAERDDVIRPIAHRNGVGRVGLRARLRPGEFGLRRCRRGDREDENGHENGFVAHLRPP